jgi:hypothetical protein
MKVLIALFAVALVGQISAKAISSADKTETGEISMNSRRESSNQTGFVATPKPRTLRGRCYREK